MAIRKIEVKEFLDLAKEMTVIDVRSPSEFKTGHIPHSINIPLFSDKEREDIGIRYKNDGRIPAVIDGLKLTGPVLSLKLEEALKISNKRKLLVYCWRGGMRSEAMSWLFSLGDIETEVLEGGYKSYRQYVLDSLAEKRKVIVLGGMTGSSKTHILKNLKQNGQQVVDLEGLANHKGSAFGSLGELPQPTTEQYANLLFDEWRQADRNIPVWVEDESLNIGTVYLPCEFHKNMQKTPAIIIKMDAKSRLPRLMKEYSNYPSELLIASILKISKRLGGDNTKEAVSAIENGDLEKAIAITLYYYDKAYQFGLRKKSENNIMYVEAPTDDIELNAKRVLEKSKTIVWEQNFPY